MGWVSWFSVLGFGFLGWSIGRRTSDWFAQSREAARREMIRRSTQLAVLMCAYWGLAWYGFSRFGTFDLTSEVVVVTMAVPFGGFGHILAVRQHAQSLFGRRLPRRLRPRLFVRR